jgi:hypothetical protein
VTCSQEMGRERALRVHAPYLWRIGMAQGQPNARSQCTPYSVHHSLLWASCGSSRCCVSASAGPAVPCACRVACRLVQNTEYLLRSEVSKNDRRRARPQLPLFLYLFISSILFVILFGPITGQAHERGRNGRGCACSMPSALHDDHHSHNTP